MASMTEGAYYAKKLEMAIRRHELAIQLLDLKLKVENKKLKKLEEWHVILEINLSWVYECPLPRSLLCFAYAYIVFYNHCATIMDAPLVSFSRPSIRFHIQTSCRVSDNNRPINASLQRSFNFLWTHIIFPVVCATSDWSIHRYELFRPTIINAFHPVWFASFLTFFLPLILRKLFAGVLSGICRTAHNAI